MRRHLRGRRRRPSLTGVGPTAANTNRLISNAQTDPVLVQALVESTEAKPETTVFGLSRDPS